MSTLEDLRPDAVVKGILPDSPVTIISVEWYGSGAVEVTYQDPSGRLNNILLYQHDEPRIEAIGQELGKYLLLPRHIASITGLREIYGELPIIE